MPDHQTNREDQTLKAKTKFSRPFILGTAGVLGVGLLVVYWTIQDTVHFTSDDLEPGTSQNGGPAPPMGLSVLADATRGLLVEGIKHGRVQDHVIFRGQPDNDVSLGNFTAPVPPAEIIAYTEGQAPTLLAAVPWTIFRDSVDFSFRDELAIDVNVWFLGGDLTSQTKAATDAQQKTLDIWQAERAGIVFASFFLSSTFSGNVPTALCNEWSDWLTPLVQSRNYNPNALNVYYTDQASDELGTASQSAGAYCAAMVINPPDMLQNVIVMGSATHEELLAHELGHALGLGHIDKWTSSGQPNQPIFWYFDERNVMYGAADNNRLYLTEGQTFRQIYLPYSAINTLFFPPSHDGESLSEKALQPHVRPFVQTSPRDCPMLFGDSTDLPRLQAPNPAMTQKDLEELYHRCPLLQTRIWPDGDFPASDSRPRPFAPKGVLEVHGHTISREAFAALQYYLNRDCAVAEHRDALQELLQFQAELQPVLIEILKKGLDDQAREHFDLTLQERWAWREARVPTTLQLKEEDLQVAKESAKVAYLNRKREQIRKISQQRSAIALAAIQSNEASEALREASRSGDEELRSVIKAARAKFKGSSRSRDLP